MLGSSRVANPRAVARKGDRGKRLRGALGQHVDADAHAMLAAADEDALDRADVAVVAAPGDR